MSNFGDKVKYFFGMEVEDDKNTKRPENREVDYSTQVESRDTRTESQRVFGNTSVDKIYEEVEAKPKKLQVNNDFIITYSPVDDRESALIIDDLKKGHPVIINFEGTEDYITAKIINRCEGAVYALDADMADISKEIYILVPKGIEYCPNPRHMKEDND